MAKTCAFKAEIRQMLDLVIHSLYSKKEIFLRELISNASDAIDRAKYLALTDKTIAPEAPAWGIRLVTDDKAHTLTIEDNGLGMSAEEMEEALGTIAKSGSKAFAEALKAGKETNTPELIGKCGGGLDAGVVVADGRGGGGEEDPRGGGGGGRGRLGGLGGGRGGEGGVGAAG